MQPIADNGAHVLVQDGPRLAFLRRPGLVPAWALFVAGLLAVVFTVNGAVMLALQPGGGPEIGVVLLALGVASVLGLRGLWRRRAAGQSRRLVITDALVVLNRDTGVLTDGRSRVLAPLSEVRFARVAQLTSSAKALQVIWPGGRQVVYRGDPFAGSIDAPVDALRAAGIRIDA